jgi:hypothetical protein
MTLVKSLHIILRKFLRTKNWKKSNLIHARSNNHDQKELLTKSALWASPKESMGAPDQMTVSQHSKSEGWHPSPLSPPPSSLYCNLYIKELYLRHKYCTTSLNLPAVVITSYCILSSTLLFYLCKAILKLNNTVINILQYTHLPEHNHSADLSTMCFRFERVLRLSHCLYLRLIFLHHYLEKRVTKLMTKYFWGARHTCACLLIWINITTAGSLLPLIGLGSAPVGFMWIGLLLAFFMPFTLLTVHANPWGGGGGGLGVIDGVKQFAVAAFVDP